VTWHTSYRNERSFDDGCRTRPEQLTARVPESMAALDNADGGGIGQRRPAVLGYCRRALSRSYGWEHPICGPIPREGSSWSKATQRTHAFVTAASRVECFVMGSDAAW